MVNLNEMKVAELKGMAKELGVSNWWTLKKDDLITEISLAIADREDAGEDVDVEALANAEPITEPNSVPMLDKQDPNRGKKYRGSDEPESEPEAPKKPKRGELIHYNGKAQNLCAWANELGVNPNTLYGRLYKLNWPIEKAFAIKK